MPNKTNELSLSAYQSPLGFHQRPAVSVHFVVESTSVAQVMSSSVPSPERSGRGAAVHTLTTL